MMMEESLLFTRVVRKRFMLVLLIYVVTQQLKPNKKHKPHVACLLFSVFSLSFSSFKINPHRLQAPLTPQQLN